jgi:predicted amidohydrolase
MGHDIEDPAYPSNITVACANFASVPRDKAATLAKMEQRVREAARQGAQLIAFPEGALNTCAPCTECSEAMAPCAWHIEEAEVVPGPATEHLAAVAAELDIYVVFGMNEADPDDPSVLYNAAALVGPEGILGTMRKLHLGHPSETCRFTPGDELPVWQTRLGPIGILICYDFWSNPELSRILALKGARLLVNPTRSADDVGKRDYVRNTTVVRAQENLIYAMSANWPGPAPDGHGAGTSTIAGPAFPAFNNVIAEAGVGEELILANLNFNQLGAWYDLFPWRSWRLDEDRQLAVTRLVAEEFAALADPANTQT